MIPFNKPYCSGRELKYLEDVCHSTMMSGNGPFTKKCHQFFEEKYGFKKALLCTSGTDARAPNIPPHGPSTPTPGKPPPRQAGSGRIGGR